MDERQPFGRWLQRRRKALGLTQRALAERAGCAAVTIHKLETDRRRPSAELAARLADTLQIPQAERPAFLRLARGQLSPAAPGSLDVRIEPDGLSAAPPIRASVGAGGPVPRPLPIPLTPLIGRTEEVAALRERLSQPEVRLLTLVGAPGIGKTRLGIQVAGEMEGSFADGVAFVALAPIRDAALMAGAIAQALGIHESGKEPRLDTLIDYLYARELLLVLDNLEHVVDAAPLIIRLLEYAPRLKVLATSRLALRVPGEYEYEVPPLALPDLDDLPPVETLATCGAVDLFVRRAQAVQPDFALTEENAATVAALCVRLDGLPLALELAAVRMRHFAPAALLDRLDRSLELLTCVAPGADPRHHTLRAAVAWSYDLLGTDEQALFRRLGVFAGGWTLEAAETVSGPGTLMREDGDEPATGGGNADPVDLLTTLVDQSLIRGPVEEGGKCRFMMHETIRAFALEQLAETGELATLQRRHAMYYLRLAEAAAADLDGSAQADRADRLEAEHNNLRAALNWALDEATGAEEGQTTSCLSRATVGVRLAIALWPFWRDRGHESEGAAWLDRAMAQAEALRDRRAIVSALTGTVAIAGSSLPPRQVVRLLAAASALLDSGNGTLDGDERDILDQQIVAVRNRLDQAAFEAAWASGRELSLGQVVAEAREIAQKAINAPPPTAPPAYPADLTEREVEVLQLLAQGLTNAEIAERLIISRRTVDAHLRAIYAKIGVSSRSAATRFAVEQNLV